MQLVQILTAIPLRQSSSTRPAYWAKLACKSALGTVVLPCPISNNQGVGSCALNHDHLYINFTFSQKEVRQFPLL